MIQAIKFDVNDDNGNSSELSFEYEEDVISVYLKDKFICSLDYKDNFKEWIDKMVEQW